MSFVTSERERAANRARKERYRGTCLTCGVRTTGCRGPGKAPRYCNHCAPTVNARWTRETVREALRLWAARNGRTPSPNDLRTSVAPDYPSLARIQDVYGSWGAAVDASGLPRLPLGRPRKVPA